MKNEEESDIINLLKKDDDDDYKKDIPIQIKHNEEGKEMKKSKDDTPSAGVGRNYNEEIIFIITNEKIQNFFSTYNDIKVNEKNESPEKNLLNK